MKRLLWASVLALALSSCGGGGAGSSVVPSGVNTIVPVKDGLPVTLSLTVPVSGPAMRAAKYISSSTQSISVVLTSTTTGLTAWNQTYNVTPTTGGCVTLGTIRCTFTLYLAPDTYSVNAIAFQGTNGTGNELSINKSASITVKKGVANALSSTMYGIPASWHVTSNTTLSGSNYVINGIAPQYVSFAPYDAAGNAITGTGTPSAYSHSVTGTGNVTVAATTGNTLYVTASDSSVATSALNITASFPDASVCTQSGAVCSTTASVQTNATQKLFVANQTGNTVTVYGAPYSSPSATITGLSSPTNLAFDSSGDLFVGNSTTGTVDEYASPYTGSPINTFTPGSKVTGLALDPSDNLYISDGTALYKYSTPYSSTYSTVINSAVYDIAFAPNGDVAYVIPNGSTGSGSVEVATATFSGVSNFAGFLSSPTVRQGFAWDSSSRFFIADASWNVYYYPYPSTTAHHVVSGSSAFTHLAGDANGHLFYTNSSSAGEYTDAGSGVLIVSATNSPFVNSDNAGDIIAIGSTSNAVEAYGTGSKNTVISTGISGAAYAIVR